METLQLVFDTITGNVFYMILAIALITLVGYGLVKKLFKLAMVFGICFVIYISYIAYTQGYDGVEQKIDNFIKGGEQAIKDAKELIPQ